MCVRRGYWHGSRIEGFLRQQNNLRQNITINLVNVRLRAVFIPQTIFAG